MTTSDPMTFLLARMRASVADPELFDDPTVVGFLSDGYVRACERSHCLRAWTPVTMVSGQQEYAVPADWVATIGVYQGGDRMTPLSTRIVKRADLGPYFYETPGVLGLVTIPQAAGSLILHYARRPAALDLGIVPESQFGPEWYRLMVAYAKWHCYSLGYGAEKIRAAMRQRALFDTGVANLRRWSTSRNVGTGILLTHALDLVGRPITREWAGAS